MQPSVPLMNVTGNMVFRKSLTITCAAWGIPAPKLIIYHNHTYMSSNDITHKHSIRNFTTSKQVLTNLTLKNSGTYTCCSKNVIAERCVGKDVIVKGIFI